MRQEGITLIEILVVVAIVGLLAALAGVEYAGWTRKYTAENEIRVLYGDLMGARVNAMQKNVRHMVALSAEKYDVCEDDDLDGSCDSMVNGLSKSNLKHSLLWGLGGGGDTISFDRRGLSLVNGHVNIVADGAEIDCVNISATRINVGRMRSGACVPK